MQKNLQIFVFRYFFKKEILDFIDFAHILANIIDPTQRVLPNIKKTNIETHHQNRKNALHFDRDRKGMYCVK